MSSYFINIIIIIVTFIIINILILISFYYIHKIVNNPKLVNIILEHGKNFNKYNKNSCYFCNYCQNIYNNKKVLYCKCSYFDKLIKYSGLKKYLKCKYFQKSEKYIFYEITQYNNHQTFIKTKNIMVDDQTYKLYHQLYNILSKYKQGYCINLDYDENIKIECYIAINLNLIINIFVTSSEKNQIIFRYLIGSSGTHDLIHDISLIDIDLKYKNINLSLSELEINYLAIKLWENIINLINYNQIIRELIIKLI